MARISFKTCFMLYKCFYEKKKIILLFLLMAVLIHRWQQLRRRSRAVPRCPRPCLQKVSRCPSLSQAPFSFSWVTFLDSPDWYLLQPSGSLASTLACFLIFHVLVPKQLAVCWPWAWNIFFMLNSLNFWIIHWRLDSLLTHWSWM